MNASPETTQRHATTPMPVFVIGMQRFPERHENTLKQLADAGIPAQFFPGVDLVGGESLAPDEKVNPYFRLLRIGDPLGLGALGCYFAHYRLLKHLLTLDMQRTLILECDVRVRPHTKDLVEEVAGLDETYELVYLFSSGGPQTKTVVRTLSHKHILRRCLGPAFGSVAYAITRPAIEKLLPQMIPMRKPYDTMLGKPYQTGLESFAVRPYPFGTLPTASGSIIRQIKTRYEPPGPAHRILFRLVVALLAKPARLWRRGLKPFDPNFWQRRLYWRRFKDLGMVGGNEG